MRRGVAAERVPAQGGYRVPDIQAFFSGMGVSAAQGGLKRNWRSNGRDNCRHLAALEACAAVALWPRVRLEPEIPHTRRETRRRALKAPDPLVLCGDREALARRMAARATSESVMTTVAILRAANAWPVCLQTIRHASADRNAMLPARRLATCDAGVPSSDKPMLQEMKDLRSSRRLSTAQCLTGLTSAPADRARLQKERRAFTPLTLDETSPFQFGDANMNEDPTGGGRRPRHHGSSESHPDLTAADTKGAGLGYRQTKNGPREAGRDSGCGDRI